MFYSKSNLSFKRNPGFHSQCNVTGYVSFRGLRALRLNYGGSPSRADLAYAKVILIVAALYIRRRADW